MVPDPHRAQYADASDPGQEDESRHISRLAMRRALAHTANRGERGTRPRARWPLRPQERHMFAALFLRPHRMALNKPPSVVKH